ncbi:MAG TPA: HisA/HisF-related TIM barrel protein [Methanoregula sp.]|nr:HisA/HisF-related TIM barrel protein [Methanoregula sp.]
MKLILAMDLRQNLVVHGKSGQRETYKPLDWGCSPTAKPIGFVQSIRPENLYIADLDRIGGTGSHDAIIQQCAKNVRCCYVDRGCQFPSDVLAGTNLVNIVGTETGGDDLSRYHGGFLSIDVKQGLVIPSGKDPVEVLTSAQHWDFEGCILLDVSAVGTEKGIDGEVLRKLRRAYDGKLMYGGGVGSCADLETISESGFDGAIISTALHRGIVPIEWIRRGCCC